MVGRFSVQFTRMNAPSNPESFLELFNRHQITNNRQSDYYIVLRWNKNKIDNFNWITLPHVSAEMSFFTHDQRTPNVGRESTVENNNPQNEKKRNDITLSWLSKKKKWNLFLINFMIFRCVVKRTLLVDRGCWEGTKKMMEEAGKWYSILIPNSSFYAFLPSA